jgi:predicted nucleic acid-binding protein
VNHADTNWLEALYISAQPGDPIAVERERIVERFARKHGGHLVVSHIVLLEARIVFSRSTGQKNPAEWSDLEGDFNGRIYVDPMNWDVLRRECDEIAEQYASKVKLGAFDMALIAAAKLGGGRRFLSFDTRAKALAAAEGMEAFPPLDAEGKRILARLRG